MIILHDLETDITPDYLDGYRVILSVVIKGSQMIRVRKSAELGVMRFQERKEPEPINRDHTRNWRMQVNKFWGWWYGIVGEQTLISPACHMRLV